MPDISLGVAWYIIFLISTSLHEAAHGFAAKKLGDPTAHNHGLMTINPIPHIQRSPIGLVVVPIASFLLNGWIIGWASTIVDPYWAQNNRKKDALVSAAGPLSNLALVLLAAILIRTALFFNIFYPPESITFANVTAAHSTGLPTSLAIFISITFSLNLILAFFNLIPLPPLDGSQILKYFLSNEQSNRYQSLLSHPQFAFIGLLIAWHFFPDIFAPINTFALNILYTGEGSYGAI